MGVSHNTGIQTTKFIVVLNCINRSNNNSCTNNVIKNGGDVKGDDANDTNHYQAIMVTKSDRYYFQV